MTVVAPDTNQSAVGHQKTLMRPLRVRERTLGDGSLAYSVDGSPTDAVSLAFLGYFGHGFDLVAAGINYGANLGDDITYSGTVSAAMEAVINNCPAFAISQEYYEHPDFVARRAGRDGRRPQHPRARPVARASSSTSTCRRCRSTSATGVEVTRLGKRVYQDQLIERLDPRGIPYFWIGGPPPSGLAVEGTDFHAVVNRRIAVTPIHLDLTGRRLLRRLRTWDWTCRTLPDRRAATAGDRQTDATVRSSARRRRTRPRRVRDDGRHLEVAAGGRRQPARATRCGAGRPGPGADRRAPAGSTDLIQLRSRRARRRRRLWVSTGPNQAVDPQALGQRPRTGHGPASCRAASGIDSRAAPADARGVPAADRRQLTPDGRCRRAAQRRGRAHARHRRHCSAGRRAAGPGQGRRTPAAPRGTRGRARRAGRLNRGHAGPMTAAPELVPARRLAGDVDPGILSSGGAGDRSPVDRRRTSPATTVGCPCRRVVPGPSWDGTGARHAAVMDTSTLAATRIPGSSSGARRLAVHGPPRRHPHLVPIWFWWDGEALLVFSKPDAQKVRNLRANPSVMLALGDAEDDFDVGLLEGRAEFLDGRRPRSCPPAHLASTRTGWPRSA